MKTNLFFITILISTGLFGQENWTKHEDNPILKRDTVITDLPNDFFAISDNWVLKDGETYKMWYTCAGFNYPTDEFELNARICYCESEDGINWEKYEENPVLDIGYDDEWDSLGVETISVIIDQEAPIEYRYKMWYSGLTGDGVRYDVGYAYSPDGLNWSKHPDPVLTVGTPSQWDNGFIEGPCVLKVEDEYKMWYAGLDNVFDASPTDGQVNIGFAHSTDGINWEKHYENPILTVSSDGWDSIYVQDPHVLLIEGEYHMWYGGVDRYDNYGQQVGYAHSNDGINWTKSVENPILEHGEEDEWDANTASFPTVILDDDNVLKMWYTGKDVHPLPEGSTEYYWEIGYATGNVIYAGLDENAGELTLLYPNPFKDVLYLKGNQSGDIILIQSASGSQVYLHEAKTSNDPLYLDFLEEGIYFIFVNNEFISKVVKF